MEQFVILGQDNYQVIDSALGGLINPIKEALCGNITDPISFFTGNCQQDQSIVAIGTIAAGDSQTDNIENHFVVEEDADEFTVTSSPIIAQGAQDSPGLTALEKVEKLKKQSLDLPSPMSHN
jgi:hypothetical protein